MLKLSKRGQSNEERKILPSKKGGAGGVLARTIGRALSNLHPPMVAGWGLLCRHFGGVWVMSKIEHYEFMLKELNLSDRHRYWIERELAREQAIKEQTKEWLFHHNLIREGSE